MASFSVKLQCKKAYKFDKINSFNNIRHNFAIILNTLTVICFDRVFFMNNTAILLLVKT